MNPSPAERDPRTDAELVAAVRKGGPGRRPAFDALVFRTQGRVGRLLAGLLGNPTDVDDVIQNVYLRAYTAADRWPPASGFSAWLRTVTVNAAYNHRRKQTNRARYTAAFTAELQLVPVGGTGAGDAPELGALFEVLDSLSYPFREVLLLRYVEDLDVAEIAKTLSLGASATKMRLKRARDAFREAYERNQRKTRRTRPP